MSSGSGLVSDHVHQSLHHLVAQRPELDRQDWAGAIKAALVNEDEILLDRFNNETAEPAISGSTVAICCINLTQGELVVSNLGDSHVILAERDPKTEHPFHIVRIPSYSSNRRGDSLADNGHQRRLTETHKPEVPSERARIEKAGGEVVNRSGTHRLGEGIMHHPSDAH